MPTWLSLLLSFVGVVVSAAVLGDARRRRKALRVCPDASVHSTPVVTRIPTVDLSSASPSIDVLSVRVSEIAAELDKIRAELDQLSSIKADMAEVRESLAILVKLSAVPTEPLDYRGKSLASGYAERVDIEEELADLFWGKPSSSLRMPMYSKSCRFSDVTKRRRHLADYVQLEYVPVGGYGHENE